MDSSRSQEKQAFFEASELEPEAQNAYLDELARENPSMAGRVRALLDAESRSEGLFERPGAWPAPGLGIEQAGGFDDEFVEGQAIGPYRLRQEIGHGGFGTVWLAWQESPVKRRVALKVLKPGLDTREVVARFEAERQALALMDHPCIARVFDGGTSERGRPYFVMEYVSGRRITEACDARRLDTRSRLELFLQVCGAVQHAHQKGVIHRDLKPSNVLVTEGDTGPLAKVIDFGVAKAVAVRLTDQTLETRAGQVVGTPSYMSPEQLDGSLDVDTRADVYSLGVLLYELLCGAPPFDEKDLADLPLFDVLKRIRETEPPKPSDRFTSRPEGTPTGVVQRDLRGDLDWIVMRCLEKDKERRYETVAQLAAEVRRHLSGDTVLAGPPRLSYRLSKLARRHRVAFGAAALVFLSLVAGVAVSTDQAFRAWRAEEHANNETLRARDAEERARNEARRAADSEAEAKAEAGRARAAEEVARTETEHARRDLLRFRAISTFLEDLLVSVDPAFAQERDTALLLAVLEKAEGRIEEESGGIPEVEATLRRIVGGAFYGIAQWERALPHLRLAVELREGALGPDHEDTLVSKHELAGLLVELGDFEEGALLMEETLEHLVEVEGPEAPQTLDTLSNLATAYGKLGRRAEAIEHLEKLERLLLEQRGEEDPDAIRVMNNLAGELQAVGRSEEAIERYERALALQRRTSSPSAPDTLKAMNNLAFAFLGADRAGEALPLLEEALEHKQRVLSPGHPSRLIGFNNLAQALEDMGRLEEAEEYYLGAIEEGLGARGPRDRTVLGLTYNYGAFLDKNERFEEVVDLLDPVLQDSRAALGELDKMTLRIESVLANGLHELGQDAVAEPLAAHAARHVGSVATPGDGGPGVYRLRYGRILHALGRIDEARAVLEESLSLLEAAGAERMAEKARTELARLP